MASFTLTIDDALATRAMNALCAAGGYDVANKANALETLRTFIRRTVHNYESDAATQAALSAVAAPADLVIT